MDPKLFFLDPDLDPDPKLGGKWDPDPKNCTGFAIFVLNGQAFTRYSSEDAYRQIR
jgi:hypothetical protein